MKKYVIILSTISLLVLALIACSTESPSTGSLRVYFGNDTSRLLAPESSYSEQLDSYNLELVFSDGTLYRLNNIKDSSITIKDLPIGNYQLVVYGYKDGVTDYRAKGNTSFRLYANDNSVTVPLNFNGSGSFKFTANVDLSKIDLFSSPRPEVSFSFFDSNMVEKEFTAKTLGTEDNGAKFVVEYDDIPSGTYVFKAVIKRNSVVLSTIIETLIIYPSTKTVGESDFIFASSVDNLDVKIIARDNSMALTGEIEEKAGNNAFSYSIKIIDKPIFLKQEDLKITWLLNGEKKSTEDTLVINKSDISGNIAFVSALISTSSEGIIGTASTVADFSKSFLSSNPGFILAE